MFSADLGDIATTQHRHGLLGFLLQDLKNVGEARTASDRQRPALELADRDSLCPEGERLAHLGTAGEAAVNHHLDLGPDRANDLL